MVHSILQYHSLTEIEFSEWDTELIILCYVNNAMILFTNIVLPDNHHNYPKQSNMCEQDLLYFNRKNEHYVLCAYMYIYVNKNKTWIKTILIKTKNSDFYTLFETLLLTIKF